MKKRQKIAICLALSGVILANTNIERQIGQNNFNLVAFADSPSLIKGYRGGYATNTIILDHEFINNIKSVEVNGSAWSEDPSDNRPKNRGVYYLSKGENGDEFSIVFTKLNTGDKVVIKSDKKILSFTISNPTDSWSDNLIDKNSIKEENIGAEKEDPQNNEEPDPGKTDEIAFSYKETFGKNILGLADGRKVDKNKLEKIIINGKTQTETSSPSSVFGNNTYAFSMDGDLCIVGLNNNDSLSITYDGIEYNYLYKDKKLVDNKNKKDVTYQIRLVGKFDNLLVGQTKIDGFSGGSVSVSNNPNAVSVEYTDKKNPSKDDWKKLEDRGNEFREVKAVVVDKDTGIEANFAHGSISLGGSPTKAGTFKIKISATDIRGKKVESNEAEVEVHNLGEQSLEELLSKAKFIQTQDKKYMWEMSPWKITKFNDSNNIVNVRKDLKAWFGSHQSGTYGELGFETIDEPTQTLVVGQGANLTFKNMKILGSVKIIVKDGGILNLDDSVVFGKIEVSNSGKLNVNYNPRDDKITTGASIWGQVVLKDGAILGNSSIYSNTNSAAQGKIVNTNDKPIIKVEGRAKIEGDVSVRGDEQATYGKYGQPALEVGPNGNLEITENSSLNLFGGGVYALTSVGGDALKLDGGSVTGKGKLVAIGGSGSGKKGGSGVSGHGSISVSTAYIRGGNSSKNPAKAVESNKIKFEGTKGIAIDGKKTTNSDLIIPEDYWSGTQKISDKTLKTISDALTENKDKPINQKSNTENSKTENGGGKKEENKNPNSGKDKDKGPIKPDRTGEKNHYSNYQVDYLPDYFLNESKSKNFDREKYNKLKEAYERSVITSKAAVWLLENCPEKTKNIRTDLLKLIKQSEKLRQKAEILLIKMNPDFKSLM
ncbi:hypothetical protein [Anaerococcus degeneri]|uniref:Uncharacterized protein n=1 Tax=Anaerococcus degeneri TaxID=361500 RepID=A0ABS7Z138_9FIRM|nr:hypothetical protein [Anaerococcus degeneri]MBP2014734.1 hypothetical protein [Anaerococcus degeneri]MCA2096943.1 hypothetical protein [Anaerococcus degeneri]